MLCVWMNIVCLDEYFLTTQMFSEPSSSERNSQIKDFLLGCLTLKIKALDYFETSGTIHP